MYKEVISDLLGASIKSKNLRIISDDPLKGAVISNLSEEIITQPQDVLDLIRRGEANITTVENDTDTTSGRKSHLIFKISLERKKVGGSSASRSLCSSLLFVNLGGCEREGDKSRVKSSILAPDDANVLLDDRSLLVLNMVVSKIIENSKKTSPKTGAPPSTSRSVVPYRDSKLTRILKPAIGGHNITCVLCTVVPSNANRLETTQTLKLGHQLRSITNNSFRVSDTMDFKEQNAQLRLQIEALQTELARQRESGGSANVRAGGLPFAATEAQYVNRIKQLEQEVKQKQSASSGEDWRAFEEMRHSFEEHQRDTEESLSAQKQELAEERVLLQTDRTRIFTEKSNLEERELKLGQMLSSLDQKESKLNQILNRLDEQQGAWQQSVVDLEHREMLIEAANQSYQNRLKHIQELESQWEIKLAEQIKREKVLSEREHKMQSLSKEQHELEIKNQLAMQRISNIENDLKVKEARQTSVENGLRGKEVELESVERELQMRRKDLEQLDGALRERERKLVAEQRTLEEREQLVHIAQDRIRGREVEHEKRLADMTEKFSNVSFLAETTNKKRLDLDARGKELDEAAVKIKSEEDQLFLREEALRRREELVRESEDRYRQLVDMEAKLNERVARHEKAVAHFYDVEWKQLTSKYLKGISVLDTLLNSQFDVISKQFNDTMLVRSSVSASAKDNPVFRQELEERKKEVEKLKVEIQEIEVHKNVVSKSFSSRDTHRSYSMTSVADSSRATISSTQSVLLHSIAETVQSMAYMCSNYEQTLSAVGSFAHNTANLNTASAEESLVPQIAVRKVMRRTSLSSSSSSLSPSGPSLLIPGANSIALGSASPKPSYSSKLVVQDLDGGANESSPDAPPIRKHRSSSSWEGGGEALRLGSRSPQPNSNSVSNLPTATVLRYKK